MKIDAFRARAKVDPQLEPRFHIGLGMIQLHLIKSEKNTVRYHVWHPDLPPLTAGRSIHNHRFSFRSEVLKGALWNTPLAPVFGSTHVLWQCFREGGPPAKNLGPVGLRREDTDRFLAGESYFFEAGRFHETQCFGLTVTRMTKLWDAEIPVMVVARPGVSMEHAYDPAVQRPPVTRLWEALEDAMKDIDEGEWL